MFVVDVPVPNEGFVQMTVLPHKRLSSFTHFVVDMGRTPPKRTQWRWVRCAVIPFLSLLLYSLCLHRRLIIDNSIGPSRIPERFQFQSKEQQEQQEQQQERQQQQKQKQEQQQGQQQQRQKPRQGETLDLVISHCLESTSTWLWNWTQQLKVSNLYIYNKCNQSIHRMNCHSSNCHHMNTNQQSLPNLGREGHTWIHHILRNDIEHSTWTAFLQGNPEYGLPEDIQDVLNRAKDGASTNQTTGSNSNVFDFVDLQQYVAKRQINQRVSRAFKMRYAHQAKLNFGWNTKKTCDYHERFKRTTQSCSTIPRYTFRGQFVASGELLKTVRDTHRPAMERLQDTLEGGPDSHRVGFWLERFWPQVLGANDLDLIPEWRNVSTIRKLIRKGRWYYRQQNKRLAKSEK